MGIREGAMPLNQSGKVLERVSLIDCIVAEIKGKILSGALKEGDMLASQDELARSLGVSRASLREAINRLNVMGLVEVKHGSGTFVRSTKSNNISASLLPLLISDQNSADELLVAQYHIESATAALAAMSATGEEVLALQNLLDHVRSNVPLDDIDEFITNDLRFHSSIAEASRNQVLKSILNVISELSRQFILNYYSEYSVAVDETLDHHYAIFHAIRNRDPVAAREKMQKHIDHLAKVALKLTEWDPKAIRSKIDSRS